MNVDSQLNMIKFFIFLFFSFIIEIVSEERECVSVGHFDAYAYFIIKTKALVGIFAWHK